MSNADKRIATDFPLYRRILERRKSCSVDSDDYELYTSILYYIIQEQEDYFKIKREKEFLEDCIYEIKEVIDSGGTKSEVMSVIEVWGMST